MLIQEAVARLIDKSLELVLMGVAGWIAHKLRLLFKDLGAAFGYVRASVGISREQENRLRKLEGLPELTLDEWSAKVRSYTEERNR